MTNAKAVIEKHNIKVAGKGDRTLVFAHGLGLDQSTWRRVYPEFLNDYQVILFDHVGCGKSNKAAFDKNKYCSLAGYADDLIELIVSLGLKKIIFVGHSVSSMIGLLAAIKRPELFDRFIFVTPSPRYLNDRLNYIGGFDQKQVDDLIEAIRKDHIAWVKSVIPSVVGQPNSPELIEEVVNSFVATDKEMLQQFAITTFFSDHRNDLLKFSKPSLIIQSEEDMMSPIQVGDYLHAHLDNSELRILPNKGHFPQVTCHEQLIQVIKSYLKRGN